MRTVQLALIGGTLVVTSSLALALRLPAVAHVQATERYEDRYYLPPTEILPSLTLGFRDAVADLVWMRALVYVGEEFAQRGGMVHVFDYADAILELDPDFRAVYGWLASAGLYQPQAVTPAQARRVADYLRRGVERFPDDGELAWRLGAVLAFELPNLLTSPEEKDAARAEGTEFLITAARLGAGPAWLALTNASILSRIGRAEAAAAHLEEMYAMAADEAARSEIAEAIAALRSQAYAETLTEFVRVEEERRLREMPYASEAFYFLAGPRPVLEWRDAYRWGFARAALDDDADGLRALSDEAF